MCLLTVAIQVFKTIQTQFKRGVLVEIIDKISERKTKF